MDTGSIHPAVLSIAASLQAVPQAEQLAERREIVQAVRALNQAELFGQGQELTFSLDRDTRRPVLKLVDRKTGEVVTQVPPEHVLRLAKELGKR